MIARVSLHRPRRRAAILLPLVAALSLAAGCAAPAPIVVPAQLPLYTEDGFFDIRWAVEADGSAYRAVGLVSASVANEFNATLDVYGVDAAGDIVTRGRTFLRSTPSRGPVPFSVTLTASGREARFIARITEHSFSGLRVP